MHPKLIKLTIILTLLISVFFTPVFVNTAKAVQPVVRADIWAEIKDTFQSAAQWISEKYMWFDKWQDDTLAAIIWKSALGRFLNRLAYDSAVYLATGDKGQAPMFETDNFGDFIGKAADTAAGDFIESFARYGPLDFNLCDPDALGRSNLKLRIGLGLVRTIRPEEPECTFTEMKRNWEQELNDPDFLNRFQIAFEPYSSDFGIALTMQTRLSQQIDRKINEETNEYITNKGIKPLTDFISGKIKTPAVLVEKRAEQAIDESTGKEKVFTGNLIADAVSVFINTLVGTLMDEWFNKGLVRKFPDDASANLGNFYGNVASGGTKGAKDQFRKLMQPDFSVKGDYDVLGELTMCRNPNNAGPSECVITDSFRQAIEDGMTVGQALKAGYLNRNGLFGFSADGLEPVYQEGYPYRSMIILRKFRILPVGWELAAQKIKADMENDATAVRNLGELVDCYDPDDEFEGYEAGWCAGLVNPGWVLKAPLNYCRRSGPGPEIISDEVVGEKENAKRVIYRNDNYCADEQTCISEAKDGSCRLYGYCTEEKQGWDFESKSCEPVYNTCTDFRGLEGINSAFLRNTLDYSICSAGNSGCTQYCADYNYENREFTCTLATGDKRYLDSDAEECGDSDEGCHEFIRTAPGSGTNLVPNSSFESDLEGWTVHLDNGNCEAAIDSTQGYRGTKSLRIFHFPGADGYTSVRRRVQGIMPEETVTVSYYVNTDQFIGGGESGAWVVPFFYDLNDNPVAEVSPPNNTWATNALIENAISGEGIWKRVAFSFITPPNTYYIDIELRVQAVNQTARFDAVKVERGDKVTDYSDYRQQGLVYQKLAPDYLGCNNPLTASPLCSRYVQFCEREEVNCKIYESAKDGMTIPAVTTMNDYCPRECVGYDQYIQSETYFEPSEAAYFIPATARSCSSQAAGCDEFTNLDKVGDSEDGEDISQYGAEFREYYVSLKRCRRPDAECSEFYTWEGSDESGYQLQLFQLQREAGTETNPAPYAYNDVFQGMTCDASSYDLNLNPMCREFYNNQGVVFYRFINFTISCSDNCHPYRRTLAITQAECLNYQGEWSEEYDACIYMAIPGEGEVCSAEQAGCREYNGSAGANMRVVLHNDFEDGTRENWENANISSESLLVGGHSLVSTGEISKSIGSLLADDRSYILKFVAKSDGGSAFSRISIGHSAPEIDFTIEASGLADEWRTYEFNLPKLDNAAGDYRVSNSDYIFIEADGGFFMDEVRLIEIRDRYYLVKNSWRTPDICYNDIFGNYQGPMYNLGCQAYTDQYNNSYSLRSFESLCREEAVGCESMIDTHNYSSPAAAGWNGGEDGSCDGDGDDCVTVEADSQVYVVYDQKKQCRANSKGCMLAGDPYEYEGEVIYRNKYIADNPDNYASSLCSAAAKGCSTWSSDAGESYFKDPGDHVCEWRQPSGGGAFGWYKKKVKRCGGSGAVCIEGSDCEGASECLLETADTACGIDEYEVKTIGFGQTGDGISLPTVTSVAGTDYSWAGTCPVSESGCTEYIDPLSRFSTNILFNGQFAQDADANIIADGWNTAVNGTQNAGLQENTLYIFAVEGANSMTVTGTNNPFRIIGQDNSLGGPQNSFTVTSPADSRSSLMVYVVNGANTNVLVQVSNSRPSTPAGGNNSKVEIKPAIIDYQIASDVDKSSCNGRVDSQMGCVLFDERTITGGSSAVPAYSALAYDGDNSPDSSGNPVNCTGADCDSNSLISVRPGRDCDKWLACRSYVKDENNENVCFDVGLCNRVDENGQCSNFIMADREIQRYSDFLSNIENLSGYSKVTHNESNIAPDVDYYHLDAMEQTGEFINLSNGNFELKGENKYPVDWQSPAGGEWTEDLYKVMDNPIEMQKEGIGNAPEGRSVLKMGAGRVLESGFMDVAPGTWYYITAYVNTKALVNSTARIYVDQYNNNASVVSTNVISRVPGQDWSRELGRVQINNGVSRIKLRILSEGIGGQGNFHVDDIKIKAVLNSGNTAASLWYTPQSCRLYPQQDALSCEYIADNGMFQKGQYGYCLEYDRFPGNKDACLLWYPVDRVKGEGIEEWAGYTDRYPLYYCTEWLDADNNDEPDFREVMVYDEAQFGIPRKTPTYRIYESGGLLPAGLMAPGYIRINEQFSGGGSEFQFDNALLSAENNWTQAYIGEYADGPMCQDGIVYPGYPGNWCPVAIDRTVFVDGEEISYYEVIRRCVFGDWPFEQCESVMAGLGEHYKFTIMHFSAVVDPVDNTVAEVRVGFIDHTAAAGEVDYAIYFNWPACGRLSQVVKANGESKFWAGRVREGSEYEAHCRWYDGIRGEYDKKLTPGSEGCYYNADYRPFGSVVTPIPAANPYEWDSKDDEHGRQPLLWEAPNKQMSMINENQPRMGQLYNIDSASRLFSQSYNTWIWDGDVNHGQYVLAPNQLTVNWNPPDVLCPGGVRPADYFTDPPVPPADYCAIRPEIPMIRVNSQNNVNVTINNNGFVNLTFNSRVNVEQLPLVMYAVDWGDDNVTTVSGVEMRDRPENSNPHSLFHLYSYWDIRSKTVGTNPAANRIYCGNAGSTTASNSTGSVIVAPAPAENYCVVRPRIMIKDNWGWCNDGTFRNDCDTWQNFGAWVVVTE